MCTFVETVLSFAITRRIFWRLDELVVGGFRGGGEGGRWGGKDGCDAVTVARVGQERCFALAKSCCESKQRPRPEPIRCYYHGKDRRGYCEG